MAKKILQVAEDLNYQPNEIAKSLRTGSTKSIGLIVADIANPFFGQLSRIIEDIAFDHGYTVLFGSSDEDTVKTETLVRFLLSRRVDGLIIVPTEGSASIIQSLHKRKTPFVLIDRYFPEINSNYVILNNHLATYEATSTLIQKGYKNICMVAYKTPLVHMKERINGYSDALFESGLSEYKCVSELKFEHTQKDVDNVINSILKKEKKAEAILFATNALSVSGLKSLAKNNVLIPENLAVVGFDGGDAFELYRTPLTFVKQPLEEMGKEAFRVLHDLFNGSTKTSHIILNPSLELRDSC